MPGVFLFGDGGGIQLIIYIEVLKAIPDVINESKTLGEKIIEVSKDKLSSGFTKLVEVAISEGFKLMLTGFRS